MSIVIIFDELRVRRLKKQILAVTISLIEPDLIRKFLGYAGAVFKNIELRYTNERY